MPSATHIQSEIDRRAKHLCRQRVLPVDYYRIRKRLAVPLPILAPLTASYPVRNFTARYPWNVWLLWALEDRIETLGAAVTFLDSAAVGTAVVADLAALAAWPGYRETNRALAFAHAVRILWVAVTQWDWLDAGLQTRLHAALERAVADALPLSDRLYAPPSGDAPIQLNAALVLRSGHAPENLALAMGLSRSPMSHVQCDNGSLVLGTAGRWWLDDPGYQQYLRTAERTFTLGPSAHNAPVINAEAQRHKRPTLLTAMRLSDAPDVQFALVDLTACYPPEAGVTQVWRAVWLIGRTQLLVCDQVQGATPVPVAYHWHGHPELYWCIQQGEALWWLFSFAETRPPLAKL
ncbi:heparinase II/III domain-containing protein [Halochromatium roseum]|uniref:heparinase II/III domain-containing protein n=1 Tax=Halochromatium roseum TaxID=391920 RepID=UPI00191171CB|nr:heparinase II/III family protein [Halochromatium roseum]MBK5938037.1 hypothetical protein [Halochromatium roseum]